VSLARKTAQAALNYALSLVGRSRKLGNAVWTNSAVIDDCARFCSHVLFGGNPGPISWVDTFKTAGDGSYHRGKAGLQPGDVVLFDWEGNGVGNHVEFCLTSPSSTGAFTTVGANGSDTVAVKVRNRNGYVLGYFRPAWGSASPTPGQPQPGTDKEGTTVTANMYKRPDGTVNLIDPNGVQDWHVPNTDYVNLIGSLGITAQKTPKSVPANVFSFLQTLAGQNRAAIAAAVWDRSLSGSNGSHKAGERLVGADTKAGTAKVTIDAKATDTIAAGVFSRIAALFTSKK